MDGLVQQGVSVQLKHVPGETSRDNHGFVRVLIGDEVIAQEDAVQHNKNFGRRVVALQMMLEEVMQAIGK